MKVPTNIWDLAIEQSKEKRANVLTDQKSSDERSLLILGSRNVGKTTLIHRFLDSQDSPKPTLALEYTFGRKTNNNLAKVNKRVYVRGVVENIDPWVPKFDHCQFCLLWVAI